MTVLSRIASIVVLVSIAPPAVAQTTGRLEGTVTDATGAVIRGAGVTVSGSSLIAEQTVRTDDGGSYHVFNLPPGQYTVRVSAAGFHPQESDDVAVNLDRTTTLDVSLSAAGGSEEVTVTSSDAAPIDVTSSEANTIVTAELFDRIPTTRTLQSVINIAPSVVGSGLRDANGREASPSVAGSSGPENNYILDGVRTTDPATGLQGSNIAFDFIQEVQVKTGAFSAEYGEATGGIVNAITKSGGDEFHGDVFYYFNPSAFVADARPSAIPSSGAVPNGYRESDFGADVGGPVVRRSLWFFAAANPQFRTNRYLGQSFLLPYDLKIRTPFYAGKLTWQIDQNHRLTASTFSDRTTLEGGSPNATGFSTDVGYLDARARTGGPNYAFRYEGALTDRLVIAATLGLHSQRFNVDALDPVRAELPLVTDAQAVDPNTGRFAQNLVLPGSGLGALTAQRRGRWEVGFDVTYLKALGAFGEHAFKGGYEYQDNHFDVDTTLSGGGAITNYFRNANPSDIDHPELAFAYSLFYTYRLRADTHTKIHSFYVQDGWRPFRELTLNLGVRWEMPTVEPDPAAREAYAADPRFGRDYYFKFTKLWENAAPRLGFAYDFTGSGRGKIYGSFARFFESAIPLDINARAASGETYLLSYYAGPNGTGDLLAQIPLAATPTAVDPGLKASYVNEATAGVEYEVVPGLAIGARFVWRNLGRIVEDGSFDQGSSYFIMNPGESVSGRTPFVGDVTYFTGLGLDSLTTVHDATIAFPTAIRRYRAVEITATRRYSDRYTFVASYTWSKLYGNYEGLYRNDNGQLDPNITSLFDFPELLYNTNGRLPNDRPHQFKFDGSYDWTFGLGVGVSFRAQSGTPVSYLGPHPIYGNGEAFLAPRGAGGRTPMITNTDVHVAYTHNFTERLRGQVILDVFNVMDQQKAILVDQNYRLNVGRLEDAPVNPLYGSGRLFQYPRAARVGLKFQF